MSNKPLTVTIIIPTYNEEHHLPACLSAIAAQTIAPDEVIVVDNNSTDQTVAIAESFPFVRVIYETKQGHAAPRNKGFDVARSDIIGKIDADSVVDADWVARVRNDFSDSSIVALTGLGKTDSLPRLHFNIFKSTFWCRVYYWGSTAYFHTLTTWGANMAIRSNWWLQIRDKVRDDDKLTHDDQDVALLIAGLGGRIVRDNKLLVTTCGQSYHYFPKLMHYAWLTKTTREHHEYIGTFANHSFVRLAGYQTIPRGIASKVISVPFTIVSFCLWPLDAIVLRISGWTVWFQHDGLLRSKFTQQHSDSVDE